MLRDVAPMLHAMLSRSHLKSTAKIPASQVSQNLRVPQVVSPGPSTSQTGRLRLSEALKRKMPPQNMEVNGVCKVTNSRLAGRTVGSKMGEAYAISAPRFNALCGTALCFVMNPITGAMVQIRALLDSGANMSLLNRQTAQQVGLSGKITSVSVNTAGGGTVTITEKEVALQLVSRDRSFVSEPMVALTTASVGNPFPAIDFRPSKHSHLKDLELADKFPSAHDRPFQLILAEPYFSAMERDGQQLPISPSLPMAKLTALGWVLRGALDVTRRVEAVTAYGLHTRASTHETFDLTTIYQSLNFDFAKFWTGENVGISLNEPMTSKMTALKIRAEAHHRDTAKYDPVAQKWTVQLPWIDPDLEAHHMTNNLRRVIAMLRKVHEVVKGEDLDMVDEAYMTMITQKFAEEIPESEMNPSWPLYYLPSRPVIQKNALTTKCRIVMNGSCPDQNDRDKTLNKMLMPGPNKLPQIMELVMQLMIKARVFLIDIQKCFCPSG